MEDSESTLNACTTNSAPVKLSSSLVCWELFLQNRWRRRNQLWSRRRGWSRCCESSRRISGYTGSLLLQQLPQDYFHQDLWQFQWYHCRGCLLRWSAVTKTTKKGFLSVTDRWNFVSYPSNVHWTFLREEKGSKGVTEKARFCSKHEMMLKFLSKLLCPQVINCLNLRASYLRQTKSWNSVLALSNHISCETHGIKK